MYVFQTDWVTEESDEKENDSDSGVKSQTSI